MLYRVIEDPDITRPTATLPLPMISFEIGKLSNDKDRKLNTINKVTVKDPTDKNSLKYQYMCVPYNIEFKVYIYTKNVEDGTKIIEQILPFFTPDWTTQVKLIPEMEEIKDIPIILTDVDYSDSYDGQFKDRRMIIWSLTLLLKGYMYGPIRKTGIIKFVKVPFYIPAVPDGELATAVGNTQMAEMITVQPGLTANGQPTSNINLTIPYQDINVDDDYGFITQIYSVDEI